MGTRDARIDAYIGKSADFAQPILQFVREQVHANCPDVTETIKWGMPHFEYRGSILCSCAGFKQHCAINFWLAKLLSLEPAAERAMGQFGRIRSLQDLPKKTVFAKLVKEAMKLQNAGTKIPARAKTSGEKKTLTIPAPFQAALNQNQAALTTFASFSYTKKKDYVSWYEEAKTDATRVKRLDQSIQWLAEGKSRNWKYENC